MYRRLLAHNNSLPSFPSGDSGLVVPLVDVPGLGSFDFLVETSFGLGWPEFRTGVFGFQVGDFLFGAEGVELGHGGHVRAAEEYSVLLIKVWSGANSNGETTGHVSRPTDETRCVFTPPA